MWVATFTTGCYTVTLAGPARTFAETFRTEGAIRKVTVTHSTWVRAAPGPVDAQIDERWLSSALAANHAGTPDALAIAMQYIASDAAADSPRRSADCRRRIVWPFAARRNA